MSEDEADKQQQNQDSFLGFQGQELHVHITGSISASLVPWWLNWLRSLDDSVIVNVSISESGSNFVSERAISALVTGKVWTDRWDHPNVDMDVNYGRSGGSECFLIFPATLDTVIRLAEGRCDTPALMMLQMTDRPIIIASTFPGGNAITEKKIRELDIRKNVYWVPHVEAYRAKDRSRASNGFNFPGALELANNCLIDQEKN